MCIDIIDMHLTYTYLLRLLLLHLALAVYLGVPPAHTPALKHNRSAASFTSTHTRSHDTVGAGEGSEWWRGHG